MKKILMLTVGMAGVAVFAQNESSVSGIMTELAQQEGSAPVEAVSSQVAPVVFVPDDRPQILSGEQVQATVDESISSYAAGQYKQARSGFERVLLAHPDNATARYFLEKISRKERRNTEEAAMEIVDQA